MVLEEQEACFTRVLHVGRVAARVPGVLMVLQLAAAVAVVVEEGGSLTEMVWMGVGVFTAGFGEGMGATVVVVVVVVVLSILLRTVGKPGIPGDVPPLLRHLREFQILRFSTATRRRHIPRIGLPPLHLLPPVQP